MNVSHVGVEDTSRPFTFHQRQALLEAAAHLATSERGRNAMRRVLEWLDEDGLGLDEASQDSVLTLLTGAWGEFAGSSRDAMRDALQPRTEKRADRPR